MSRDTIKRNATRVRWLTVYHATDGDAPILNLHLQSDAANPIGHTFVMDEDMAQFLIYTLARELRTHLIRTRLQHTVEGKRLQVNASATRYQNELQYLASVI